MMEAGNDSNDEQHRGSIMGHLGSLFQQNKSNAAFAQFSGAATYGHAAAAHSDTRSLKATKAEDAEEAAQRSQSHRESGVSNTLRMFERGMSAQVLDVRWDRRGGQRERVEACGTKSSLPPTLPFRHGIRSETWTFMDYALPTTHEAIALSAVPAFEIHENARPFFTLSCHRHTTLSPFSW